MEFCKPGIFSAMKSALNRGTQIAYCQHLTPRMHLRRPQE